MFTGMSNHSVDSKGRIVLPAKFRESLGESFYLARGFGNCCVQAISVEQFEELNKKIMELPANKAMAFQYVFSGTAEKVTPNAQGRVLIPQTLREFAKIEGEAVVVGMINRIEIWNKDKYFDWLESRSDIIAEAMADLHL